MSYRCQRDVLIGNNQSVDRRCISGYRILSYRVNDFLTAFAVRQILECVLPLILCVQFSSIDLGFAVHQMNCDLGRTEFINVIRVIPDFLNLDVSRNSGVREFSLGSCLSDFTGISCLLSFEVRISCLNDGILNRCGQTFSDLTLAVLQRKLCNAILKRHVAIGSVDRRVVQRYGECEVNSLVRIYNTLDFLGNGQVTGYTGIGEYCLGCLLLADRSGIAGLLSGEAISRLLLYRVLKCCRQILSSCLLAVLQREGRDAILEGHVAIGPVDRSVCQGYGELELNVLIRCFVRLNGLCNCQVAGLTSIGECRLGCLLLADCSGISGLFSGEAISRFLCNLVAHFCRQTGCRLGFAVLQCEVCNAVLEFHLSKLTIDSLIVKSNGKLEFRICICCKIRFNSLGDLQISSITRVGESQRTLFIIVRSRCQRSVMIVHYCYCYSLSSSRIIRDTCNSSTLCYIILISSRCGIFEWSKGYSSLLIRYRSLHHLSCRSSVLGRYGDFKVPLLFLSHTFRKCKDLLNREGNCRRLDIVRVRECQRACLCRIRRSCQRSVMIVHYRYRYRSGRRSVDNSCVLAPLCRTLRDRIGMRSGSCVADRCVCRGSFFVSASADRYSLNRCRSFCQRKVITPLFRLGSLCRGFHYLLYRELHCRRFDIVRVRECQRIILC